MQVQDLNDDILVNIFTYLNRKTITNVVPYVCSSWNRLFSGSTEYIQQCVDLFAKKQKQYDTVRITALGKDYLTNWIWKELFRKRFPPNKRSRSREKRKQRLGKPLIIVQG